MSEEKPENKSIRKEEESDEKFVADAFTAEDRLKQAQEIEAEVNKRPLVGWIETSFDGLKEEFKGNPSFAAKIPHLEKTFAGFRRIRGDGNCFYRSFFFLLVEKMLTDKVLYASIKSKIDGSMKYLEEVGYTEAQIDFFVDEAKTFFSAEKFPKNDKQMNEFFANKEESMFLVWFMRLIVAGFIKHHWFERFVFFAGEQYTDANDYCMREVEPVDKECEQIQVISLCEHLDVRIQIEYLDQSPSGGVAETSSYFFGSEKGDPVVCLLYRPGHYDILYKTLPASHKKEVKNE